MEYTSIGQLQKAINTALKVAVSYLVEKVYNKLIEFIDEDIYSYVPHTTNPEFFKPYERTYEFRNKAWDRDIKSAADKIVGEIFYDGMKMSYNPAKSQHGSKWGEDRRARLAEILNNTIKNPNSYFDDWDYDRQPWPMPYWDHTIQWLESEWDALVKEALSFVGLK